MIECFNDAISCQLWVGLVWLINDNNAALGCGQLEAVELPKNQAVAAQPEFAPYSIAFLA